MITINAIELAAGIGSDVNYEIDDLDEMITNGDKPADIQRKWNHISSLLTGMAYVLDYTEEDTERHELTGLIEDMRDNLSRYRRRCMEIIWSAQCGRKVEVKMEGGKWALAIEGNDVCAPQLYLDLDTLDDVQAKYHSLFR